MQTPAISKRCPESGPGRDVHGLHAAASVVLAALSLSPLVSGQDPGAVPPPPPAGPGAVAEFPTASHPLVAALPAAARAPAPPWVQPGARMVFQMGTLAITWGGGPSGADQAGLTRASGHGYVEYTVVGLLPDRVALEVRNFVAPAPGAPVQLAGIMGQFSLRGAGDAWVHPDLLRQALGMNGQAGVRAVRMPYELGGRTYDAIRIDTPVRGQGNYPGNNAYTYDAVTGVLLRSSVDTGLNLAQQTFVGLRPVKLPWAGAGIPAWLAGTRQLQYQGTMTMTVPGAASIAYPAATQAVLRPGGPDWLTYSLSSSVSYGPGAPPQTTTVPRVSSSVQVGALWVSPAGLGALRPGQVLDTDPVTRTQVVVRHVGPVQGAGELVVLAERGAGWELEYGYDRARGLLVYASKTDQLGLGSTRVEVRLAGQR